jgi:hypothetical protein
MSKISTKEDHVPFLKECNLVLISVEWPSVEPSVILERQDKRERYIFRWPIPQRVPIRRISVAWLVFLALVRSRKASQPTQNRELFLTLGARKVAKRTEFGYQLRAYLFRPALVAHGVQSLAICYQLSPTHVVEYGFTLA